MGNIFEVSDEEKKRILGLHESTKKGQHILKENTNPKTKAEYPSCVQQFGDPVDFGGGSYGIKGTGDWVGYNFGTNYYYDPNTKINNNPYFCRGNEIVFGERKTVTKSGTPKVTDADTDMSVVGNGQKIITMGSTGPLVKQLQGWLQKYNWGESPNPEKIGGVGCTQEDTSKCDGRFGQGTKEAVMAYQKIRNLNVDGVVGQQFYQTMYASAGVPVKKPTPPPPVQRNYNAVDNTYVKKPVLPILKTK